MRIDVLTLFPGMFTGPFDESIIKRARERGIIEVEIHDIREYAEDRHRVVDDYPYGGGAGMVMKPEPVHRALQAVKDGRGDQPHVILMTPQGEEFGQELARELSDRPWLVLLCGHYEGVDERIRQHLVDQEISIGDYVLTGGELPAMVVMDTVVRLLPGVMGSAESADEESFSQDLLEYPQYTRPAEYEGWQVPKILLSGNHGAIRRWRREQAILRTAARRPELLGRAELTAEERDWLNRELRENAEVPAPPDASHSAGSG